MKLSDLTVDEQNDPKALARLFSNQPNLLMNVETCRQLDTWIQEKNHPAVKYALSLLREIILEDDKCKYDLAEQFFIMNECGFCFDDIDIDCLGEFPDLEIFNQYLKDTDTILPINDEDEYRGKLSAIQYISNPKEKLHPLLFMLYSQEDPSPKAISSSSQHYQQAAIIISYWKKRACHKTDTGTMFQRLLTAFKEIPKLPTKEHVSVNASNLSSSMSRSGILLANGKEMRERQSTLPINLSHS